VLIVGGTQLSPTPEAVFSAAVLQLTARQQRIVPGLHCGWDLAILLATQTSMPHASVVQELVAGLL
jgi:hypothetical protein